MYIKTTRNSQGQSYYHLVESYREGKKVKQRTLLSLGKTEDNKIKDLTMALQRHGVAIEAFDAAKEISISKTYIFGPLHLLGHIFEKTGIQKTLSKIVSSHPKLEFDFKNIIFTLVASRFIKPVSKLAVFEEQCQTLYPELINPDVGLHHFYRAMDLLAEHKDEIERSLYWHDRDLLNSQVDVVLYDLTTLRFESTREDHGELCRFGFSKEKRSDCTQVILGLLVDTKGIPLGFEVYPGNTFEGHTLSSIVEKMREKFKVRRFIFVADRGLFSKDNLVELKKDKGEFIVGMRLDQAAKKEKDDFYNLANFVWQNEELAFYETTFNGDRCVITWSQERAERDRKVREDIVDKIRKKLEKRTKQTSKSFISNQNYKRFLKGLDKGVEPVLDEEKISEASQKDGFYAILSNIPDLTWNDLYSNYRELWKIEDAFGELKGPLKSRPIFHWTDERIIGHLTLCFLTYLCEAHMAVALREADMVREGKVADRALTVSTVMRELSEVRAIPVTVRGQTLWVRTDISGGAAKLFTALRLRIPPKILKTASAAEIVVAQTEAHVLSS